MPRPRKSILSKGSGTGIEVHLIPVPADTAEARKRLSEAYELVAHFIGLSMSGKRRKLEKEETHHAA